MENKTPGLTKLILIFEPLLLAVTLISLFFLKDKLVLPNLLWLWFGIIIFSIASFLFFLILFIIALAKRNLRTTYWAPLLLVAFLAFLAQAILMFTSPYVMQPKFVEVPVEYVETETVKSAEVSGVTEATTAKEIPVEEVTEQKSKTNIFEIGDAFKIGDLQFTINGVRTAESDKYNNKPSEEGYIFLFIDTSIENLGSKEVYIHPNNNFRLVDKNGRNYNFVWAEGKGSIEGNLGPGRKISGEQSYGIPKDINEYELEVFNREIMGSSIAIVTISISQ